VITRCASCGKGKLKASTGRLTRTIAGHRLAGDVACTICGACGERFYATAALVKFEATAAAALAEAGASSGEALRFMRNAVGLKAAELAELLNLTPESISHVETGKREADRRTVALVIAMAVENRAGVTTTIDRLRALGKAAKGRRVRR
jgi:putative zinc finger/helix-turn-helix YgiT family protein